jgi:hypothetical protein
MEYNRTIISNLPECIDILALAETRVVYLNGNRLDVKKSQFVRNHSPDGFNWGYGGSGPSQLALAILLEFLPNAYAQNLYQEFKFRVVSTWQCNQTVVAKVQLRTVIEQIIDKKQNTKL